MSTKVIFALVYIAGVFVSAIAQILLKKSAGKTYESKIREYLNPYVIISYSIFFGATFCTIYAYKEVPLSLGPILAALEYIFVAALSRIVLKEKINLQKFIGLSVIVAGIVIYSLPT